MTANRTKIKRSAHPTIPPQAVTLYRRCRDILDADSLDAYRNEYATKANELTAPLGRKPWQQSVLHVSGEIPPDYLDDEIKRADWRTAWSIRVALDALVARDAG